jgi:hypothetical protein
MLVHVGAPEPFPHNRKMTVANLKEQLSKLPGDANVVVLFSGEPNSFLKIDNVSLHIGTPSRNSQDRFAFTLQKEGPSWVFITSSPA